MTTPARTRLESVVEDRRLELGIRKQEVAARAGVTPAYLRRVLIGKHPLSPDVQAGLERALEFPRGHLRLYLAARQPSDELASPPPDSRYTQAEWDRLDADDRRLLTDIQRKLQTHAASARVQNHPIERRRSRGA